MSVSARVAAVCGAFVLLLGLILAGPSAAAPYTTSASISVSESAPCHGAPVTLTGVGYTPGETVVLTIGTTVIGRASVDADGNFAVRITVPDALRGAQTITATGPTFGRIATTLIMIKACGNGDTDPGGATAAASAGAAGDGGEGDGAAGAGNGAGTNDAGSGGLSSTGVAVLSLLVVALGSVAVGAVLVVGGRRRRSGAARTA